MNFGKMFQRAARLFNVAIEETEDPTALFEDDIARSSARLPSSQKMGSALSNLRVNSKQDRMFDYHKLFEPFSDPNDPDRKYLTELEKSPTGFTTNFNGTGEPGIIIHADGHEPGHMIVRISGQSVSGTPEDIIHLMNDHHGLNLVGPTDIRLHVFSCDFGKNIQAAKTLADSLQRPIVAYGRYGEVAFSDGARKALAYQDAHPVTRRPDGQTLKVRPVTYRPINDPGFM